MRSLLVLALACSPALAGSWMSSRETPSAVPARQLAPPGSVEVTSGEVEVIVRVTVTAPTAVEADKRLRAIVVKARELQAAAGNFELEEIVLNPAAEASGYRKSSEDSQPTAIASWSLRAGAGDGEAPADVAPFGDTAERLRAIGRQLADPAAIKAETETLLIADARWRAPEGEAYRQDVLHAIREHAASTARHLPKGGKTELTLPDAQGPVQVIALGGRRFALALPFQLKHLAAVTDKDGGCGCEGGE